MAPLVIAASGQSPAALAPGQPLASPSGGLGDLRLVPRLALGHAWGLSFAVLLPITLPTASAPYAGQGGVTASPGAAVEYLSERGWRVDANAGLVLRRTNHFVDVTQRVATTVALAGEVPLPARGWSGLATLSGELAPGRAARPLELLGAARYRAASGLDVLIGGGPGLTDGYGTPRFRLLAAVGWSPRARPPVVSTTPAPPTPEPEPAPAPAPVQEAAPAAPALLAAAAPEPPAPEPGPEPSAAPAPAPAPPPAKVELAGDRILVLEQIHFATDRDVIEPGSLEVVDQVAGVLRGHPDILRVRVEGHTDDQGGAAHNVDLSQRRAARVRQALAARGVEPARLEAQGYGAARPIESNATAEGRRRNRRVEFVVLERAR